LGVTVKSGTFGNEAYVKELFKKIDLKKDLSEIPRLQRREKVKPLSWYEEQSKRRNQSIKSAYDSGGYSIKEIGSYYHLNYSRVSRMIAQQRKTKHKT